MRCESNYTVILQREGSGVSRGRRPTSLTGVLMGRAQSAYRSLRSQGDTDASRRRSFQLRVFLERAWVRGPPARVLRYAGGIFQLTHRAIITF